MQKIEAFAQAAGLLGAQLRRGVVTNSFLTAADCDREARTGLYVYEADGELLVFRDRGTHYILNFFLQQGARPALPELDKRLHGFALPDAVMTAPETRSSSPVRIVRGEDRQSAIGGLYPCGEGAGYAGGIMSAAVDGMLTAEAVIAAAGALKRAFAMRTLL